jgi:GrpB-like predicted nucleotidyltransferase (UPF0157 family)
MRGAGEPESVAARLARAGLGLGYDDLRLDVTSDFWSAEGALLRLHVVDVLGSTATAVEHIGSSAVVGLLAKPIVDLAIGVTPDQTIGPVRSRLEADGWISRGDAGDNGGHILVLEDQSWHRVAHAHVVPFGGRQWSDYLRLREVLRTSSEAREQYAAEKRRLLDEHGHDRIAYTDGKTDVMRRLLDETPDD